MRYLFLSFCLMFATFAIAQQTNEVKTTSGYFTPSPNQGVFTEMAWQEIPSFEGSKYVLVQFYTLPSELSKQKMKEHGIELINYLPVNCYHAKVKDNFIANRFEGFSIRSVHYLSPIQKIYEGIKLGNAPLHAQDGNLYKLMLSLQKGVMANAILQYLQSHGAKIWNVYNQQHIALSIHPSKVELLAAYPFVEFIDWINSPLEKENIRNKTDHRSNALNTDYGAGRHYDGLGVRVALTDDGKIGPHIDYTGRTYQDAVASVNNGDHGDHCGGTIMSAGNLDPLGRGMAPACELWVYEAVSSNNYILDDSIYTSPVTNIDIVSTSYSDGCNGDYNAGAESADRQIRELKNVMRIFSAGNNGTSNCGYGAGAGWGNITGGIKIAKNLICVANLTYTDLVAASSSRGPTSDGRLKPDVSGVGTDVYSTIDTNKYELKTGTSMSCPGVAGVFTQLYQAYRDLHAGQDPNTGLLRGILMNTCDDAGNPGPDFKYGYGRINGLRAVKVLENNQHIHDSVAQGITKTATITVPPNTQRVKIMLHWLDREAAVSATTVLVNDLDMIVTDPAANSYLPWVLNSAPNATTLDANATRAADHLNNAEQVTIDNPVAGTYTIAIDGFSVPFGPQEYYISYEIIANDAMEVVYPIGGEGFVPGEVQTIRWDAIDNGSNFDIDYSTDNGSSWTTVFTGIASFLRHYNWTIPNTISGRCRLRITRNGLSKQSPAEFSIMQTPENLKIDFACPDTMQISWAPDPNATHYQVFKLGNKFMDSIATTTDTFFQFVGLNIAEEHWFSAKAFNASNQALSRRAFAVQQKPGIYNCILQFDAASNAIVSPTPMTVLDCGTWTSSPVAISITNAGMQPITNLPIHYTLNAASPINEVYTGTISPGATITYTFLTPISAWQNGLNTVQIWTSLSGDQFLANDTLETNIVYKNSVTVSMPWAENFESMPVCPDVPMCDQTTCTLLNNLTNEANYTIDDFDWKVNNGATPTTSTGPDVDHTFGTTAGKYIYLETSYCYNKSSFVLTPCFDFASSSKPTLQYWYHMYGSSMGSMHVDAFVDGLWQLNIVPVVTGDQGNSWKKAVKDLSMYAGKKVYFRFRGLTGSAQRSDMAIDDILISDTTSTVGVMDKERTFALYPNPVKDLLEIRSDAFLNELFSLEIYNPLGEKIRHVKQNVTSSIANLDLSDLSSGVYFLVIKNEKGIVFKRKLVKE
jgi:hypothetical protein